MISVSLSAPDWLELKEPVRNWCNPSSIEWFEAELVLSRLMNAFG